MLQPGLYADSDALPGRLALRHRACFQQELDRIAILVLREPTFSLGHAPRLVEIVPDRGIQMETTHA